MADVNVNIKGRDDGLGEMLSSLREKVRELGTENERFNNLGNFTHTEQRRIVSSTADDTYRAEEKRIRDEYNEIRRQNTADFGKAEADFGSGKISSKEFEEQKRRFGEAQQEARTSEEQELKQAQKDMTILVRNIYREMVDSKKIEREHKQRDREEFGSGKAANLNIENESLKRRLEGATTQEEKDRLNALILENESRLSEMDEGGGGSTVKGIMNATGMMRNAQGGNISGMVAQGGGILTQALGGLATTAGAIAASVTAVIGVGLAGLNTASQMMENATDLASLRGTGWNSYQTQQALMSQSMEGVGGMGIDVGLDVNQLMQAASGKARRTGIAGNALERTVNDAAIKRTFGVDVAGFDQFQRFNSTRDESSDVALDILNVLNQINRSSLKEGDLATFGEKLQTTQTLMEIQRSKRDLIDTDKSLRVLAGFESIGLSEKGEKAGTFLQQTIQGLGEGGGDNSMLFKYEAAMRAHPELRNDPLALRKFVRWNSDDPEYMSEYFKYMGQVTEGNEMAFYDAMDGTFPIESSKDYELYKNLAKGNTAANRILEGDQKLSGMRSGTMTQESAIEESSQMIGSMAYGTGVLKEMWQESSVWMQDMFNLLSGKEGINVSVVKNTTGSLKIDPTKTLPK